MAEYHAIQKLETRIIERRSGAAIVSPDMATSFVCERFEDAARESFTAILLDTRSIPIGWVEISTGTLDASLVHPREVFQIAIREGAKSIIVLHNHPSGDPKPSAEDDGVTQRLAKAGEILGIRLLDHIVIGERRTFSYREHRVWALNGGLDDGR